MKKQNIKLDIEIKNILDKIFAQREEEIYNIRADERKLLSKKSKNYSNMYIAINNVPSAFRETKKGIETSIENYLETLNDIQGIENKKFYEEGFADAINLMVNCLNRNKEEL